MQYITYGWPINASNTEMNDSVPNNQKGANDFSSHVDEYIKEELKYGSIIGPFTKNPFGKIARFSPIDTRPKRNSSSRRIIMNLSHPFESGSVNHSIDNETYVNNEDMTIKYPTVEDLCNIIRNKSKSGKKVLIFIRDLRRAYRQLWACPGSVHLLGFSYDNFIFFDVALSMGSKSSAYCCQRFSDCITFIFKSQGYEDVNYLDDLGGAEEENKADEAFQCLGHILQRIGVEESKNKATPPSFIAVFLGILINTITMTLEITSERRDEIKAILTDWLNRKSATLKDIQKLLGKLNFVCSTVRAGRVFITRIINELKRFPTRGRRRLSKDIKMDIRWWSTFMDEFDGISVFPDNWWSRPDEVFATDASLKMCGGWSSPEYFKKEFPTWILSNNNKISINELELLAFIVALKMWKHKITNKNILAFCDNQSTIQVINHGRANNSFAQRCLREIVYITAHHNAVIRAVYIATDRNRIPDSLSRWWEGKYQQNRFRTLTKDLNVSEILVRDDDFEFSHNW